MKVIIRAWGECNGHNTIQHTSHPHKTFSSEQTGCFRVDSLLQSGQRYRVGRLLRARHKYHASICIWPSDCSFAVSSHSVGNYPMVNKHSGIVVNCDHTLEWVHWVHQKIENQSGSLTQTSHTLRLPSPVLLSTSRCSLATLEICKVLSDSARAFSGALESICSDGGEFRALEDLTLSIIIAFPTVTRFATF